MILDGTTLLTVTLILAGFATCVWLLSAYVFKNSPTISINFALTNFFLGAFMFFYINRTTWPNSLVVYMLSDINVVLGCLFLRRATEEFTSHKKKDLEFFLIMLVVTIIDFYSRLTDSKILITIVVCATSFYGVALSWKNAYGYMIKNFRKSYSIITTSSLIFMAALLFIRILVALFATNHVATVDLRIDNSANTSFLIVVMITIIGFNATAIGLVISKMITQIKTLSQEDPLTKAFNRRHLNILAEEAINNVKKNDSCLSIVVLDIDHFKKVNDVYGHAAGDAALVTCVEVIRSNIRSTDYIGRLGGEEFCILLPNTDSEKASALAERIRFTLESTIVEWEDKQIPITASFGITSFHPNSQNEWSNLLNKADQAMYKAKNNGRNQVVLN